VSAPVYYNLTEKVTGCPIARDLDSKQIMIFIMALCRTGFHGTLLMESKDGTRRNVVKFEKDSGVTSAVISADPGRFDPSKN